MKKQIIAVSIPIAILLALTTYNEYLSRTLPEVVLPIEGYDPRDLLAGHYLTFRIKYEASTQCTVKEHSQADMCVSPKQELMESGPNPSCKQWIRGHCVGGTFQSDLNRYYVPQEKARDLEKALLNGEASVRISVGSGNAIIKDLLIKGRSWKEY